MSKDFRDYVFKELYNVQKICDDKLEEIVNELLIVKKGSNMVRCFLQGYTDSINDNLNNELFGDFNKIDKLLQDKENICN